MIFATRLQQVLHELGVNQSELARRLDVKPQSVQGWLRGVTPRMDKLEKLAEISSHPVYWFFMEDKVAKNIPSTNSKPELSDNEAKVLELLDDLPDSETEQIIRDMEQKRDYYRRKVQELLDKRNKPA